MYNIKNNFKNNKTILLLKELKKFQLENNYNEIKTLPAFLYFLNCKGIQLVNTKIKMNIIVMHGYVLDAIYEDFIIFSYLLYLSFYPIGFIFYDIKSNCITKSNTNIINDLREYKKLNKKEYAKIVRKINAENRGFPFT